MTETTTNQKGAASGAPRLQYAPVTLASVARSLAIVVGGILLWSATPPPMLDPSGTLDALQVVGWFAATVALTVAVIVSNTYTCVLALRRRPALVPGPDLRAVVVWPFLLMSCVGVLFAVLLSLIELYMPALMRTASQFIVWVALLLNLWALLVALPDVARAKVRGDDGVKKGDEGETPDSSVQTGKLKGAVTSDASESTSFRRSIKIGKRRMDVWPSPDDALCLPDLWTLNAGMIFIVATVVTMMVVGLFVEAVGGFDGSMLFALNLLQLYACWSLIRRARRVLNADRAWSTPTRTPPRSE